MHPFSHWEDKRNENLPIYTNFDNYHGAAGTFRTAEFRVGQEVRCYQLAYPSTPGIEFYLLDVRTQERLPLKTAMAPSLTWRERIWPIPRDWQGKTARFVVETPLNTSPDHWVGITIPETGESSKWLPFARAAYRSFFLTWEFALFLFPGIVIACSFTWSNQSKLAAATLISSALVGYAVFWIYVLSTKAGPIASVAVFLASAIQLYRLKGRVSFNRGLRLLALAVVLLAIFYNSLCFLYYTDDGPGELVQTRFGTYPLPPDNLLQNIFADRLAQGMTVRPFLISNAHASDRPPLQTAAVLEQRPFWKLLNVDNSYQLLSEGLQCLWLAGLFLLLRQIGIDRKTTVYAAAFAIFTLFAWQNSIYVWPKLLAASFCLIGMAAIPVLRGERRPWTLAETLIASLAFTLSLLSHSGSGFTILAVGIFVAVRRALPPWRYTAIAIGTALLLVLPWRAYQIFVDPPGDTLFKLHLAGITDSKGSLFAALAEGYGKLTMATYTTAKLANFKVLFTAPAWQPFHTFHAFLQDMTDLSFFSFFPCAGLLNLGLLARVRLSRNIPSVRAADRLLVVVGASLLIWCLLMFEAGSTYVHQGSYTTVLLYFAAMMIYLVAWSPRFASALIVLQAVAIFPFFVTVQPVFGQSPSAVWNNPLDWGMALSAITSLVLLAWCARAYLHYHSEA